MNSQPELLTECRKILTDSVGERMKCLLDDVLSSQVVECQFERAGIFVAVALELCAYLAIPIKDEGVDRLITQFKELIYNKKLLFDTLMECDDTRN